MKTNNNINDFEVLVENTLKKDQKRVDSFLQTVFEEYAKNPDEKALLLALRTAVKAKLGFTELSKKTGLKRETLYRTLSEKGNPTLHTINLILHTLNCNLKLEFQKAI
jgi:probable addiction module antidote protein